MTVSIMHLGLMLLPAAVAASCDPFADSPTFRFPTETGPSISPSGNLVVHYFDPGRNADGLHEYVFRTADSSGHELARFIFTRSVAGAWAPGADRMYVNHFEGSNLTDCLVLSAMGNGFALESLTVLLTGQVRSGEASIAHITASPDNSHFYLVCRRWMDSGSIEVRIDGYTDAEPGVGQPFSYRLRFSLPEKRFHPL